MRIAQLEASELLGTHSVGTSVLHLPRILEEEFLDNPAAHDMTAPYVESSVSRPGIHSKEENGIKFCIVQDKNGNQLTIKFNNISIVATYKTEGSTSSFCTPYSAELAKKIHLFIKSNSAALLNDVTPTWEIIRGYTACDNTSSFPGLVQLFAFR